jgi:HAD superfamily hydrolase (TIGR01509 family)
MRYTAIGFDYGGVLAGRSGVAFAMDIARLLDVDFETYQQTYTTFKGAVNRGEISWEQLWERMTAKLGKPDTLPAILELDEQYVADLNQIREEMLALVDALRAQGLRLGLLSNNTLENAKRFRDEGLAAHFDVVHVSAETGFVKPEPAAFTHFADALGVDLSQLIYIDDSQISLSTATELGYAPILFENYDKLKTQLQDMGVTI